MSTSNDSEHPNVWTNPLEGSKNGSLENVAVKVDIPFNPFMLSKEKKLFDIHKLVFSFLFVFRSLNHPTDGFRPMKIVFQNRYEKNLKNAVVTGLAATRFIFVVVFFHFPYKKTTFRTFYV